ncbi:hypothetical protein HGP14_28555 [Rhizobium sp. P32RR-XVIII]|uniref:hypothetical protein n=1 Tax=Rhizobium sp. P32RR-XVIII TaxID=2726738 RepID=UPI00145696EB|nr:hypothetical protein [Rhizobium sp. P32RR-XVIII]NLS07249.1 hypothetical protein [Rhizobium sp. P32RR-XVIII]
MSRLDETKAAIVERLRALRAAPQYPIDLYDICVLLRAAWFTPDELHVPLTSREQEAVIELIKGNRLLVTNPLA